MPPSGINEPSANTPAKAMAPFYHSQEVLEPAMAAETQVVLAFSCSVRAPAPSMFGGLIHTAAPELTFPCADPSFTSYIRRNECTKNRLESFLKRKDSYTERYWDETFDANNYSLDSCYLLFDCLDMPACTD
jgi:hypothetical protein